MTTLPLRATGADGAADLLERVVIHNDLTKLTPRERLLYYQQLCASLGLNPLGRPFAYLYLDGKLTLYTTRACTDQLRARHGVRIEAVEAKAEDGLYIVLVRAALPDGRTDQDLGAVALEGLKGTARANAIMKAITKGKRRVTLSLLGLGLPDESEVDDLPQALRVDVDAATGEIQPPLRGPAMPETAAEFRPSRPRASRRNASSGSPASTRSTPSAATRRSCARTSGSHIAAAPIRARSTPRRSRYSTTRSRSFRAPRRPSSRRYEPA